MNAAPETILGILEEVEKFLRGGDHWLRNEVHGWRMDAPDLDEDGGEDIHFSDAKQLDRFIENLGRAGNAVSVVVEALRTVEREGAR